MHFTDSVENALASVDNIDEALNYSMIIIKTIRLTNARICIIIESHINPFAKNNSSAKGGTTQRSIAFAIKKLVAEVT